MKKLEKIIIILSYIIPLFFPFDYWKSMCGLAVILSVLLLYCHIKRLTVYHLIQKKTEIDLSGFIKMHFSLLERKKYIISEDELIFNNESEKLKSLLQKNQGLFLKISSSNAIKFFYYSGRFFILKLWLITTITLSIFLPKISEL